MLQCVEITLGHPNASAQLCANAAISRYIGSQIRHGWRWGYRDAALSSNRVRNLHLQELKLVRVQL